MATASDLAVLDEAELVGRLGEAQRELFNLRFQLATGQLDNTARLGQVRRDVARLLTVLRQREIEEAEGTYVAPTPAAQAAARAHLAAQDEAARAKAAPAHDHAEAEAEADEGTALDERPEEPADDREPEDDVGDLASDDLASDDLASDDLASDELASDDLASDDLASDDVEEES
jgi:large subunit ribosomal protein L29